jgi:CDP-diacylglycerol--glycerol-3-phosphate 3-phosphatidyltransferase
LGAFLKAGFKITANVVTIARIVLLPLPCAFLIYGGELGRWVAFALYTLLGATDFVDGAMARREGPTKLGGLIDPVADKIFVASICFGMVMTELMPVWVLMAILSREFFITALRSSVAFRAESIKTSNLAKIKTVVQMGGFGTIFLTIALAPYHATIVAVLLFIGLMGFYGIYWIQKRKHPPYWVLPVAASFLYWTLLSIFLEPSQSVFAQLVVIVALTWISCIDYIVGTYKMFVRSGIGVQDLARILWAAAHTLLAAPLIEHHPQLVLPLLVSISFELALGGVDMVVASDQHYAGVLPFLLTPAAAILTFVLVHSLWVNPLFAGAFLAFVSITVFVATYVKWQFLFKRALGIG